MKKMRYSTGRGTRVRHSTAMEWDEYEKKKRYSKIRYSTGKGSSIKHFCGVLLDGETEGQNNASSETKSDLAVDKNVKKTLKTITMDY